MGNDTRLFFIMVKKTRASVKEVLLHYYQTGFCRKLGCNIILLLWIYPANTFAQDTVIYKKQIGIATLPAGSYQEFRITGKHYINKYIDFDIAFECLLGFEKSPKKNYFAGIITGSSFKFNPLYKEGRVFNCLPSTHLIYHYGFRNFNSYTDELIAKDIITHRFGILFGITSELNFTKRLGLKFLIEAGPASQQKYYPPCGDYPVPYQECNDSRPVKENVTLYFFEIGFYYKFK